jgi:hypothetical protein
MVKIVATPRAPKGKICMSGLSFLAAGLYSASGFSPYCSASGPAAFYFRSAQLVPSWLRVEAELLQQAVLRQHVVLHGVDPGAKPHHLPLHTGGADPADAAPSEALPAEKNQPWEAAPRARAPQRSALRACLRSSDRARRGAAGRMQGAAKRRILEVFKRAATQPRGQGRALLGHAHRGRVGTLPGFQQNSRPSPDQPGDAENFSDTLLAS